MTLSKCLSIAADMTDADRDALLARVDKLVSGGLRPAEAGRAAVADLLAETQAEIEALTRPGAAARPGRAEFFTNPDEFAAADAQELQASRATPPAGTPTAPAARRGRPAPRFTLPRFGLAGQTIEAIQDRYNRWKQAINAVRKQGGTVTEANDFYLAEERFWGRVGSQVEDFQRELQQFVKDVAADKLTLGDVAQYAYAKHARERNDYIASIRPDMPDGGSGMSNAEADAILADARASGLAPALERHQQTLVQWSAGTRDVLRDNGLISDEQFQAWGAMFGDYVPLKGLDSVSAENEPRRTGRGFDIRGEESKAALGRRSQAKQIIESIVQDRTRALIRAGKNEVLRSFAQFVLDNPDPTLWEINAVETRPSQTTDANGDRLVEEREAIISDERTVAVKDGGNQINILVRDEVLRAQLQNLNVEGVGRFFGGLLWANRQLSRLYTSLNPVFTVLNGARDVQAAAFGMIDAVGFMGAARLFKRLPGALGQAARAEFGTPSAEYQLFRSTGGKTGFFDFKDVNRQAQELQTLLARAERSALDPRTVGMKALELVEGINAVVENTTRFAAWQAARESGASLARASSISKNITVNFNRKGTLTPQLSAWFLFFNPAVQGTARIVQALASPKVVATLGTAMAGVAGLALMNASMGEDDDGVPWWDKIPDEVKERNLVIILPPESTAGEEVPGSKTGRYIKIPMPYGYNFFAVAANQMVDVWRHEQDPTHGRTAGAGAVRSLNAFLGGWLPASELGRGISTEDKEAAGKSLVMLGVPDALNPLAQAALNQGFFGNKLSPDDSNSMSMPDSSRYFTGQAGTIFQRAAAGLNEVTGGSQYRSGFFDITPGELETVVRGYGGGPVSFSLDILNAVYVRQSINRPEIEMRRLPFAKQLYGVIDAETDRMLGYERLNKVDKVLGPYSRAERDGNLEEVLAIEREAPALVMLGKDLQDTRKTLSELRKDELEVIADDRLSEAEKFARLQQFNLVRRQALQEFNRVYNLATRLAAEDAAKQAEEPATQP